MKLNFPGETFQFDLERLRSKFACVKFFVMFVVVTWKYPVDVEKGKWHGLLASAMSSPVVPKTFFVVLRTITKNSNNFSLNWNL